MSRLQRGMVPSGGKAALEAGGHGVVGEWLPWAVPFQQASVGSGGKPALEAGVLGVMGAVAAARGPLGLVVRA